jgi:hypothetical protein
MISNPPFDIIDRWIPRALRLTSGKVAIFGRLALLEGVDRGKLFQSTPLSRIWVFSGRVPCPPGEQAPPIDAWPRSILKGAFIAYAWFVWRHGHVGDPLTGFLPRIQRDGASELALG